ncbi:ski2-like helicase [Peptococcaceae bacterium CEB3]|nr:ski2-like helicase [Peptococcaceae bacterium CEB3]
MDDIISIIDINESVSYEQSFDIAQRCSKLLSSGNEEQEALARRVAIHILNNWAKIPRETYSLWTDIVEAIGFYPYLEKHKATMQVQSLSDEIRQKSFLSHFLSETYLHREQKKLSDYIMAGKNVIASAPTSFGKSLLIEEIVASGKYKSIVIIQPTLALLDETRLKLKKYSDRYKIIVRTSQPAVKDKGNLFLLTAERVMEYNALPPIELLIIDEFYKLSLKRIDGRANTLNNAFLKIVGNCNSSFYFLGPNIDGITTGFAEKYNAVFYKSDFSLVDCNVIDMTSKIDHSKTGKALEEEKITHLCSLLDSLKDEQTLVYCATPARARRFAKSYLDYLVSKGESSTINLPLVEWIDSNISTEWSLSEELRHGISIHDGSLQKHIGTSIIKYFNDGLLHCIFCTSTIIEGVNTSAKNVILFDGKKGGKDIDFFDYSNIKGRSGRLMEHYVGNIYNFVAPPPKEAVLIDIPFFEQNPVSDEILVNIPESDIHDDMLSRYQELHQTQSELLDIIERNGVSIDGQLNIYYQLEQDVNTSKYNDIAWAQMPNWNEMQYILGLAENELFHIDHHGISSVRQLALYLNQYRTSKNIMYIVKDIYGHKMSSVQSSTGEKNSLKYYDEAIEQAFHIYRHWFQFTVPKVFRVIDSLQRYVCEKHGRRAGSYSYFVQQLENDFLRENLSILIEFGIPASAVRQLEVEIPKGMTEDEIIQFIKKHKNRLTASWLQYEKDKLDQCL